ncbi:MAG: BspA family leucine-rich repeat surface protein [Prevotella sp.]|nr:BspA family leucine-rich repeat surface protein [Prevotella sp.]
MKKLFTFMLLLLGVVQSTYAQEPYAALSDDNTTLTFYCDNNKKAKGGMSVGPFNHFSSSSWYDQRSNIKTVVFDDSFANCTSITSTAYWFYECQNLTTISGMENLNTANVTDMRYMFFYCISLSNLDVSNFNTANVTNMGFMFADCRSLTNLDVSNFNTANVTNMSDMFGYCLDLTSLDISNFNTAKVTSMSGMFYTCRQLKDLNLSNFNTENVSDMGGMFSCCWSLENLNVSNFNTGKVVHMGEMFYQCRNLTSLDVSNFNTGKAVSMEKMFYQCRNLTSLDVSNFNTSEVENMSSMFADCGLTSLDVSNFNTANVTNMSSMFSGCSDLTSLDVSNFNTAIVTDMSSMFSGCSKLTSLDVSNFDTEKVTDMSSMFYGCSALTTIYCEEAWSCESSNDMFTGCISLKGAIIYDSEKTDIAGANPTNGYFTSTGKVILRPYAVLSDDNTKLTFYYDEKKKDNGGMGIGPFTLTYSYNYDTGEFEYYLSKWYGLRDNITTVTFDNSFANYIDLSSTAYWFYECSNLTTINGIENLNTANVTEMHSMFYGCSSLTSLDVSNFNTANVTDMSCMFYGCSGLTSLDMSNFNTANVTDMGGMFSGCSGITSLDLSNFNTANVMFMGYMFSGCSGITSLDLSNFNTANVKIMDHMFSGCSGITSLDLSNFNTANMRFIEEMFSNCSGLTTIYCNDTWSCPYSTNMFKDCTSLVGAISYDENKTDVTYANPTTGYFTKKTGGVGNVKLSKTEVAIEKGKTLTLKATVTPETLTDKSVTWESSDTKVATVTSAGKVKGVKTGTATITCTSNSTGAKATCEVIVGSVKLDQTEIVVEKTKTMTLKATVYPSSLEDKTVTWTSSDTKIATVSSKGKVKGVKTGTATITCTSNATGLSTTCKVSVGSVKLDQTGVSVEKGKTVTLKATAYPSTLEDKTVTWTSSNTSVATVSSKGKVKGVRTGTATITCTSNATGLSATCEVTVGSVKLDQTEVAVNKGETVTLKATVYPSTLEDKTVTWTSSNTAVATVSSKGKVKGVRTGTATITCTSNATGLSTTCEVTVGSVILDQTEVTVKKGKTVTLKATVYPSTLADKSVTWKSSNTSIATVTAEGKVKGIKAGTATITCTSVATGLSATCTVTVTSTSGSRSMEGDDDELTGLEENVVVVEPFDVYDLGGRKVLHQVTSLDGLPDGIYIVNGKKILKKQ